MKLFSLALLAIFYGSASASEAEPQILGLRALLSTDARHFPEEHACANLTSVITKLREYGLDWTSTHEFLYASRLQLDQALEAGAAKRRRELNAGGGRGILIPAGGRRQLFSAYVTALVLRNLLNSSLPIEVVYNGPGEYDGQMAGLLTGLGSIKVVDGAAQPLPSHHAPSQEDARKHGWSFKVWALCYVTSFTEVMLIDADNMPLLDPAQLFGTPEYQQHGNLFWPDWLRGGESPIFKPKPEIYRRLGLKVPWEGPDGGNHRTAESGQLLLDRSRHADVLEHLWWLNSHYKHLEGQLHGDKDTFPIAFRLAGKGGEYQQVQHVARQAIGYVPGGENIFHHRGMVHHAPDGRLAFHHRTSGAKLAEYCWRSQAEVEVCRVIALTGPVSPFQAIQSSHRAWTWRRKDLVMEPHRSLGCAQSQVTLDHLVKGVGDMRGGSSSSSSGPGSQASTPIESSSSNGAHHDAKAISPEHLKALWQQVAQQRAEAAARVRARREQYGGIVREEGISRWLPFLGSRGRPTAQKQHGGRRLLQMQVEGEGSVSQGETAMSMERRALLAESNPVDQIAAAAAVWRAYYHSSLTQWQHMPHGISNATLVRADMFANNRNDSYVFAWPEKSCTGKYDHNGMPLPIFPVTAFGPGGAAIQATYRIFEENRWMLLAPQSSNAIAPPSPPSSG